MTGPKIKRLPGAPDLAGAVARSVQLFGAVPGGLVLIGGVALQAYGHTRATKDVDFAVSRAGTAAVERTARDAGLVVSPLRIGGVTVALGDVSADFVDRRVEVEPLFVETIAEAQRAGFRVEAGDTEVAVVPLEYLVALKGERACRVVGRPRTAPRGHRDRSPIRP